MAADASLGARLERRVNELPVLPTVVARLMTLDREDEGYFETVLGLIESDPTFAARMLSAANAASSAPSSPIGSVRAALARLGSSGASSMILAVAVSRVFIPRDPWEKSLWRHALQVAAAARALAGHSDDTIELSGDDAYTAGLLHDVGRLVMFGEAPDTLRAIDEGEWASPEALIEVERSICGLTHPELGAMACGNWGMPNQLTAAVLHHHEPDIDPLAGSVEAMVATIRFADLAMFPSAVVGSPGYADASRRTIEEELLPKVPQGILLTAESLHELIRTTTTEVEATCVALGVA